MVQDTGVNEYGDGVAWFRGSMLGKGAFGRVYLATLKNPNSKYSYYPSLMAVKSAEVSASASIQKEREVLSNVQGCPYIIRCYGEETTMGKNSSMVYNLLLEYGSGGTLADKIKKSGASGLPEIEARLYARSILRGLSHIHGLGYVHCDLKPDNVLLVPSRGGKAESWAKIADFGLAKREEQTKKRRLEPYWRGTPMYLSPEAVNDCVQHAPSDIWALGCIVLEMLTGKPTWERNKELNAEEILKKIGAGGELPHVPSEIPKEARDFLKCCFVRNPMFRFTAEMLLNHQYIQGLGEDDVVEEEEIEDLNGVESVWEDDFGCGLFPDECSFGSEDGLISYVSDDDLDDAASIITEGTLKGKAIDTVFGRSNATEISSEVSPKNGQDFAVSLVIPAGV